MLAICIFRQKIFALRLWLTVLAPFLFHSSFQMLENVQVLSDGRSYVPFFSPIINICYMLLESDNFVQSFPFCPHIQLMISRAIKFAIFGSIQSHQPSIARFKATAGSLQPFACIQTAHSAFVKEEIILSAVSPHHSVRWTSFPFCFTVTHLFSILPQQCQDLGQWCHAHKVFWRFGRQEALEAAQECSTNVPFTQRTWEWQSAHHREFWGGTVLLLNIWRQSSVS